MIALFVENVERNLRRDAHAQLRRAGLQAVFFDLPQHVQRAGRRRPHHAAALTARALHRGAFQQAGAAALAGQLHEPEVRDFAHLQAGAVALEAIAHALFDGAVVLAVVHVDEVDHDQAGQVAQPHLATRFLRGLQIGFQRRRFDVAFFGGLAGVDVDRDQRFGLIDHQVSARFQAHRRVERVLELILHPMGDEERRRFLIGLHLLGVARHEHADEILRLAIRRLAVDKHLFNVLVVKVADRAFDQIALLMNEARRHRLKGPLANRLPQAQEIFVVPFDLRLGALCAGGAHDQPHALGHLHFLGDLPQAFAVRRVGDFAADAAAAGGVGHEHAVPSGEGQIRGQRRALIAAFFFHDLDEQDLAALDDLLNAVLPQGRALGARPAGGELVLVVVELRVVAVAIAVLGGGGAFFRLSFFEQLLPILERDLVIIGMDFVKREKAVAVAAILDERRLQRRLHSGHPRKVDVGADLSFRTRLEIKFFDSVSVDDHDPSLLGVGGVDQHFSCHAHVLRALARRRRG